MTALEVLNLSKNYGNFKALKGISFKAEEGECIGLLGSNGAGKSTTIKIITGQLKPNSGEARVLGMNPTTDPKKVHPMIGYIPDSQTVYDDITVEQNIDVFRQLNAQKSIRTKEIIEELDLTHKIKTKVKDLSKGLRQRVLIARALIHKPKVILLDEPTTGLDPSSAESIYKILEKLKNQGSTILLTTHLMNDVERLCDKIVFINNGEKIEEGSPLALKQKYKSETIEVKRFVNNNLETTTFDDISSLSKSLTTDTETIHSIHSQEPKLEDIFIKLIGEDK